MVTAHNLDKTMREPMALVADAAMRNPNVHVVRAWRNDKGSNVLDETEEEFRTTELRDHLRMLHLERQWKNAEKAEGDRLVNQPPTCLIS